MSDFSWVPDYGLDVENELRLKTSKFGDGYQQRYADGLNPLGQKFDATFTRSPTEIDSIEDFLKARSNGQSFTFTPPRGVEVKVICSKWKRSYVDYSNDRLSLTLERVYE